MVENYEKIYKKDFGAEYGLKYDPYYGLILWTGILYGGIKHVRLKDKKKTFVCLAFLSTVLLQSLRAEYVGGDMVQYLRGYTASARGGWLDPVF